VTSSRDPDRLINAFLMDGQTELADPVYDAVRATIERKRQRVVIGPWRMPTMNKLVTIGLGAAALVVALALGSQLLGPVAPGTVGGAPLPAPTATPSPTPIGGKVQFEIDGAPATTDVAAVGDSANLSGTAVTTLVNGTHTVELKCAAESGDTWAFGGTTKQTTVPGELAGQWSAVIVKSGSPQQIGIWFSDDQWKGDCAGWLASMDLSGIDPSNFNPAASGALVPPPDLAR